MKNSIPCEMIQDIMPVYIEKMTSATTDKLVKEHLETCESCRKVHARMTGEVGELLIGDSQNMEAKEDEIEFEFLKNQKKKEKSRIRMGIIITAVVLLMVTAIQIFAIGRVCDNNIMHYSVSEINGQYVIGVGILDGNQRVSHISVRKDGNNLILTIRAAASISRNDEVKDYFYHPDSEEIVDKIYMNGKLVWENGEEIECLCGIHQNAD